MSALAHAPTTRFDSPDDLTAAEPPERRGVARDGVRMLVARPNSIAHTTFGQLTEHLRPGDLVVVNNSATVAAELDGARADGGAVVVHVATALDERHAVVELRTAPDAARPVLDASARERVTLRSQVGAIQLLDPYPDGGGSPAGRGNRLWRARLDLALPLAAALAAHGRPIAYGYLSRRWPLADYQTVFAREPGSAEMPSAGRPFTVDLVTRLVSSGVAVAPITLHTGVSSQDAGEPPQPERFRVSAATARLVNAVRAGGGRVVAVGTTVTRALESAVGPDGWAQERAGWTDHIVDPDHPARVVDGLISGWHNPDASHLLLVEAVAGPDLTQRAYDAAVERRYLWHEFGDSCLLLP
ncbi:S-adenosylmethionine:tRNA ribosyltransferase-isomerase [Pilimelia columellifera]|uniref:S-adenosylmethionine:tRNA ribosyltransferase-isomerase n=1 Tax=Pilimelia columellifera subsp. columellifera TaxID=706583 RepID=A0ABP6AZ83_9ACTN